jgi:hypothetical protein
LVTSWIVVAALNEKYGCVTLSQKMNTSKTMTAALASANISTLLQLLDALLHLWRLRYGLGLGEPYGLPCEEAKEPHRAQKHDSSHRITTRAQSHCFDD